MNPKNAPDVEMTVNERLDVLKKFFCETSVFTGIITDPLTEHIAAIRAHIEQQDAVIVDMYEYFIDILMVIQPNASWDITSVKELIRLSKLAAIEKVEAEK